MRRTSERPEAIWDSSYTRTRAHWISSPRATFGNLAPSVFHLKPPEAILDPLKAPTPRAGFQCVTTWALGEDCALSSLIRNTSGPLQDTTRQQTGLQCASPRAVILVVFVVVVPVAVVVAVVVVQGRGFKETLGKSHTPLEESVSEDGQGHVIIISIIPKGTGQRLVYQGCNTILCRAAQHP